MERLDMVPRSQEEKCVLKYVIYSPRGRTEQLKREAEAPQGCSTNEWPYLPIDMEAHHPFEEESGSHQAQG